jgi:hypothetical protein
LHCTSIFAHRKQWHSYNVDLCMSFLCGCFGSSSIGHRDGRTRSIQGRAGGANRIHIDPKSGGISKAWDDFKSHTPKQKNVYVVPFLSLSACLLDTPYNCLHSILLTRQYPSQVWISNFLPIPYNRLYTYRLYYYLFPLPRSWSVVKAYQSYSLQNLILAALLLS